MFDQHCRDDEWREVLRLICGQIDELFVGKIVEHLATRTDLETWDGETLLPELPLAIWCLGEVRTISKLKECGELLWKQTIKVFETASGSVSSISLPNKLLIAGKELGWRWPGNLAYPEKMRWATSSTYEADTLNSITINISQYQWPHFMVAVRPQRDNIEALTNDISWSVRVSSIIVLAQKWKDNKTRLLLEQCAVLDKQYDPRRTSLKATSKKVILKYPLLQYRSNRAIQPCEIPVHGHHCAEKQRFRYNRT